MTRTVETCIERRDDGVDGSMVLAARISESDLMKADRDALDALEQGMRHSLEMITAREMPLPWKRRALIQVRGALRTLRLFLGLLVCLGLFVAALRAMWLVVVFAWSLGPLG